MSTVVSRLSRPGAVAWARRLNRLTITWNAVEGVAVIIVGVRASSISLIGWGFDSFVELVAGLVLAWRLRLEGDDGAQHAADRRAQRLIAICFAVLAGYVLAESVRDLVSASDPDASILGIALAALSLVVMPFLARLKLQLAQALGSRAVQAEAAQTSLCALLSGAVLGGAGGQTPCSVGGGPTRPPGCSSPWLPPTRRRACGEPTRSPTAAAPCRSPTSPATADGRPAPDAGGAWLRAILSIPMARP